MAWDASRGEYLQIDEIVLTEEELCRLAEQDFGNVAQPVDE